MRKSLRILAVVPVLGAILLGLLLLKSAPPSSPHRLDSANVAISKGGGAEVHGNRIDWRCRVNGQAHAQLRNPDSPSFAAVPGAVISVRADVGGAPVGMATTDDQGTFTLTLPSKPEFLVRVEAAGYVPLEDTYSAENLPGTLILDRDRRSNGSVRGTVRDSGSAAPIAGAVLTILGDSRTSVSSGGDGRFSLDLAKEPFAEVGWRMSVEASGYSRVLLTGILPDKEYDVALFRIVRVTGHVRDDGGRPVQGALLGVQRCPHSPAHRTGVERKAARSNEQQPAQDSARSDVDGGYSIDLPVTPLDSYLMVQAAGYPAVPSPCLFSNSGGPARLTTLVQDFTLSRGLTFRGVVCDESGKAVRGASVRLFRPQDDPAWRLGSISARSGSEGQFEAGGLLPLAYTVSIEPPPGSVSGLAGVTLQINALNPDPMTIILPKKGGDNLRIRISGARGPSPVHLDVRALDGASSSPNGAGKVLFQEDLEATVKLAPGRYAVLASTVEGGWAEVGPVTVVDGAMGQVDMVLNVGATLSGSLIDRSGRSVDIARVNFEVWSEMLKSWVALSFIGDKVERTSPIRSDASGTFKARVPVGKVRMKLGTRVVQELSCGSDVELGRLIVPED